MADLQVGVVGVDITVTLRDQTGALIDISLTSTRFLYLGRPNGRRVSKYAATLVSGGTTGQMKYTTAAATDLDMAGDWTIQAQYTNALGIYYSNVEKLPVLPNSF